MEDKKYEGIDPRLIVKFGKDTDIRRPCPAECTIKECQYRFKTNPPEEGKFFCEKYVYPSAHWRTAVEGKPESGKTCAWVFKPKEEDKEFKLNPLKASRRSMKQVSKSPVVSTTSPKKESKK